MSKPLSNVQLDQIRSGLENQSQEVLQRLLRKVNAEERQRLGPYNANLLAFETLSDLLSAASKQEVAEELEALSRIEASLCQFHLGLYGLCSDCEAQIPLSVLEQDPTEQRCPKCSQKHHEYMGKTQRAWL